MDERPLNKPEMLLLPNAIDRMRLARSEVKAMPLVKEVRPPDGN